MPELHEERCGTAKIDTVFKQLHETGDLALLAKVLEVLRHDTAIRSFVKTKLNRKDNELDFLLGRPLIETVRIYGVRVEKDEDGVYHLVSDR